MTACEVPNCGRRRYCKGYCTAHYQRLRRHGSATWQPPTTLDRFRRRIDVRPDGCWQWLGRLDVNGYGKWGSPNLSSSLAHRCSYELFIGPIPDGLVIDHLCRNTWCVSPDHLEAVTNRENVVRGYASAINASRQLARTHCKYGHEFTEENTYRGSRGERACWTCRHAYNAHKRAVRAEATLAGGPS